MALFTLRQDKSPHNCSKAAVFTISFSEDKKRNRSRRSIAGSVLSAIAAATIMLQGCAAQPTSVAQPDRYADAHLHISNYAMQGVSLKEMIDGYMGDNVARSTVIGLPLQQKWDAYEHYAGDKMPPNYYMGPRAGLYYYSLIDAMVAIDYLKLSAKDKARLDPMIVGFNPMDEYGAQHIKRLLLMYPGVFSGIGEFTVHKEIVGDKIYDDSVKSIALGASVPDDVTDFNKTTLYNPSLKKIFDFAGESGLVVNLHNDVYPATVTYEGKVVTMSPQAPYVAGLKHVCTQSPKATVYWAHTGLGRFVKPTSNHLSMVSEVLDACPNWYADLSWDLVQKYIVSPGPGMPTLADWARFVTKYQNRLLWGTDNVLHTRNIIDDKGNMKVGARMSLAEYQAMQELLRPLWEAVGPDVARKVKYENYARLFDAARVKVRQWEAAHANDDIWDLPAN